MNWHQVIEERSFELHQVVASILRQNPSMLSRVTQWIDGRLADPEYAIQSKDALLEWREVIQSRGLEGVLRVLSDRGEEACRMRHCSPFAVIMPQDERKRIFDRYEARRPRTHPAGV